ncbi:MAG: glucosamine-6-phosphate deaminase [Verrucomicrobiales bacterium]|nr:glucosamine-6-phosphate deaminase [Verrucomicrobiales bacterium]
MPPPSSVAEQFEKVKTHIFPHAQDAAVALAAEVRDLIETRSREGKPAVLGLATGSTPVPFYRELVRLHREEGLSFKNVITFNLDEYYGLNREHPESYWQFMQTQLFRHIDIPAENIHLPDGTLPLDAVFEHCEEYERRIDAVGGIDLQILGIGRTGHIGFNEPGSSRDSRTRLIALDHVTRRDAASDFLGEEHVPKFAITMGVGTILRARKLVLMAWGENKAAIVREAVEGPETESISASFLQSHPDARFFLNQSAASQLTRIKLPWLVGPVSWGKTEKRRAVCWLSLKLKKPVLKLVSEEYNENGMAELVPGYDGAYRLNIEIFNQLQHTITGWPGGKAGADDTNRPVKATPAQKRVLVLAPEPQDDVLSMGGTIERLVAQGHDVEVVYLTTGDLRVTDAEAERFAQILLDTASKRPSWQEQAAYAQTILDEIERKGPFGAPSPELRSLKALIRHGEAREAAGCIGVKKITFLDLPFYTKGRYRNFLLEAADVDALTAVLDRVEPHLILTTGNQADPSSVQGVSFRALRLALEKRAQAAWTARCGLWVCRGHQQEFEPHEIDMAVPMSPDQLLTKLNAVRKFHSQNLPGLLSGTQNRQTAELYNRLGMAEYEAIEAFQQLSQ